jgi:hypothetical protein
MVVMACGEVMCIMNVLRACALMFCMSACQNLHAHLAAWGLVQASSCALV